MLGRHSGDQVHKVKKTAGPLFLYFTCISTWGVDTFRLESSCNGGHDCVDFFQDHDRTYQGRLHPGVARNGITEIGHTNGLHTLFDELRARHPSLVVDVCAGGGRKIDLDIMERSIHKWQSDYAPVGGTTGQPLDSVQGHLMGEQHYQPLSAAGISSSAPYATQMPAAAPRDPVLPLSQRKIPY